MLTELAKLGREDVYPVRRMMVVLHYCYPSSPSAKKFGASGYYLTEAYSSRPLSNVYPDVGGAEEFARLSGLTIAPHSFPRK